jgi:hypothetical protein
MTFEGDMADPRTYDPQKVREQTDLFMEMLAERKG